MSTIFFNWKTAEYDFCVLADSIVYQPKRNKNSLQDFKIYNWFSAGMGFTLTPRPISELSISAFLLYVAQGIHAGRPNADYRFAVTSANVLEVYRNGDYMGKLTWKRVSGEFAIVIQSRNVSRSRNVSDLNKNETYTSDLDKAITKAQELFTHAKQEELYRELDRRISEVIYNSDKHPLMDVDSMEWENPIKTMRRTFRVTVEGFAAELLHPLLKHFSSGGSESSWMDDEQDWMGKLKNIVDKIPAETSAQFIKGFERVRDGRDLRLNVVNKGHWMYRNFNGRFYIFKAGEVSKATLSPGIYYAHEADLPPDLAHKYGVLKVAGIGVRVPDVGMLLDGPSVEFGEIFHIERLDVQSPST